MHGIERVISMLLWLLIPPILLQAAPLPPPPPPSPDARPAPTSAAPTRTLRLDEAVARARQNQPAILLAKATTDAAEGRREQSRAGLLPQVTATALYEKIHGSASGRTTTTPPVANGAGGTGTNGATGANGLPTPVSTTASTYDYWSFGASA